MMLLSKKIIKLLRSSRETGFEEEERENPPKVIRRGSALEQFWDDNLHV
jgi:hypothetical protein